MIYFIKASGSGMVKIGYTGNDPSQRLSALQTGSPEPLELLGTIDGGIEVERSMHERFAEHRAHGEWFRPNVLSSIEEILRPRPVYETPRDSDPRMIFDAFDGSDHAYGIVCPCCLFEYQKPYLLAQQDDGDRCYYIGFHGECGSEWQLTFRFHEGVTTSRVVVVKDCRNPKEPDPATN